MRAREGYRIKAPFTMAYIVSSSDSKSLSNRRAYPFGCHEKLNFAKNKRTSKTLIIQLLLISLSFIKIKLNLIDLLPRRLFIIKCKDL
jgi:hypothetical protein